MAQVGIVISCRGAAESARVRIAPSFGIASGISSNFGGQQRQPRSEEHTSELQSPCNLVCRLLLEKKNKRVSPLYPAVHRPTPRHRRRPPESPLTAPTSCVHRLCYSARECRLVDATTPPVWIIWLD